MIFVLIALLVTKSFTEVSASSNDAKREANDKQQINSEHYKRDELVDKYVNSADKEQLHHDQLKREREMNRNKVNRRQRHDEIAQIQNYRLNRNRTGHMLL